MQKNFFWIPASVADAAAANPNPNGIQTLLGNSLSSFFIKGKPIFSNGLGSLPKNPPDYISWWTICKSFQACVLVNNNLCGKLFWSLELPITFDERFKATSVPFLIFDFDWLSCELDNLHLEWYIESFYTDIIIIIL